ncbi:MAG: imidazolonepropionase [Cyclobacteriaceae bacterium]|nr:imidazolonepropionase [Cyclobacteriaceae bacterium]
MAFDLLIENIKGLVQVRDTTPSFLSGAEMAQLPILSNAFVAVKDGLIADYGPQQNSPKQAKQIVDATDRFVLPGFVDSHTHLVFAASREEEFVLKIKGATYEEIAASGGGILNSAKKLQAISEDELFYRSLPRAYEIIQSGTCAVEIKSGYGLTVKDEIKMLRVAKRIGIETGMVVKTTFLGAHAVPREYSKSDYLKLVIEEMIPAVATEKLADYIDVFCENGFFTPEETIRVIEAGQKVGMKPRIHANQLNRSGGVQVGVKVKAMSVDHLENIGEEEIELLKNSGVMPTALPGAAFFLGLPFPPARQMLQAGLPIAIASDYNPGSAPSGNMPLMLSFACIKMKMTPEEAINAATINTASCLEIVETHGSITKGKLANLILTKPAPSLAYLPYSFGYNWIESVFLKGNLVQNKNS